LPTRQDHNHRAIVGTPQQLWSSLRGASPHPTRRRPQRLNNQAIRRGLLTMLR